MRLIGTLLLTAVALTGCATSCDAYKYINMVHFDGATDAKTGMPLPQVHITAASIDGEDVLKPRFNGLPELLNSSKNGRPKNVSFDGQQVICTLACTFGPPGHYQLTVTAPGYQPQVLDFTIAARNLETGLFGIPIGCGGKFTGTPRSFVLKLSPQND